MAIVLRPGTSRYPYDPYWEARFDPPKGHDEGDFVIRVYDAMPGCPYRPEFERRGAYTEESGNWIPFHVEALWDEERELFQAILAKISTGR
jgi:hypothetical protein